jgi:hypothetical protein
LASANSACRHHPAAGRGRTPVSRRVVIEQLPRPDRRILHLRFLEDLTQTEIAERIGVSQMPVCCANHCGACASRPETLSDTSTRAFAQLPCGVGLMVEGIVARSRSLDGMGNAI